MTYTLPERDVIIRRIEIAEARLNAMVRTALITASTEDLALMADSMEATLNQEN